jgi:hypothetical protein
MELNFTASNATSAKPKNWRQFSVGGLMSPDRGDSQDQGTLFLPGNPVKKPQILVRPPSPVSPCPGASGLKKSRSFSLKGVKLQRLSIPNKSRYLFSFIYVWDLLCKKIIIWKRQQGIFFPKCKFPDLLVFNKCHSWAKFKIVLVRKPGGKFYYFMAKFQGSGFSFQSLNQNIKVVVFPSNFLFQKFKVVVFPSNL